MLRLAKRYGPDETGSETLLDTLTLDFDYAGENGGTGLAEGEDGKQFARIAGAKGAEFVRRDPEAEARAAQTLAEFGFVQLRVADGGTGKGRRVHLLRGPDAAEQWHRFLMERVPALQEDGWRCVVETGFGPRVAKTVGGFDARVSDAERGSFSLDLGIEVDGVRVPLLPILVRLMERGPEALRTLGVAGGTTSWSPAWRTVASCACRPSGCAACWPSWATWWRPPPTAPTPRWCCRTARPPPCWTSRSC